MPPVKPHSTLAQMQQAITLSLVTGGLFWLVWQWRQSPVLAFAGFAAIVFSYAAFLAAEFFLLRWTNTGEPREVPTLGQLFRAWCGEAVHAPLVFCWRQPFWWNEVPDLLEPTDQLKGRRGAVFIHGFVCNRGFWTPWLARMRAMRHAFVAVNLEPPFGSIDHYAPIIDHAVSKVAQATGLPPVLVCHSMGGLAARAWLRNPGAADRVHHVITIGSPHRGTWLARFSRMVIGRQMQMEGSWLRELAVGEQANSLFTCWYSDCDNIVFPVATATLPGADNRLVHGIAHVSLAFHPGVMQSSLDRICAAH